MHSVHCLFDQVSLVHQINLSNKLNLFNAFSWSIWSIVYLANQICSSNESTGCILMLMMLTKIEMFHINVFMEIQIEKNNKTTDSCVNQTHIEIRAPRINVVDCRHFTPISPTFHTVCRKIFRKFSCSGVFQPPILSFKGF